MRLLILAAAALAMTAPPAFAQPPGELIVGEWACTAQTPEIYMEGPITYIADGTMTAEQMLTGQIQGRELVIQLFGKGEWEIDKNGMLSERILEATAPMGSLGGAALSEDALRTFAQDVVVNGVSVSEITVTETDLRISDGQGGGTFCER